MISGLTELDVDALTSAIGARFPYEYINGNTQKAIKLDGKVVAIMGIEITWPGVAQCWTMLDSKALTGHGLFITRQVKKVIEDAVSDFDLRQVRAMVMGDEEHGRWMCLLGFEPEGIWAGAAPDGGDVWIFVYHRRN